MIKMFASCFDEQIPPETFHIDLKSKTQRDEINKRLPILENTHDLWPVE